MVKYIIAGLSLALAISLSWGLWAQGKVNTQGVELKTTTEALSTLQGTLEAIRKEEFRRSELERQQTEVRAKAKQSVQAVRAQVQKESYESNEPRATATPAQLDRLRRLSDAGNAAVQSASGVH